MVAPPLNKRSNLVFIILKRTISRKKNTLGEICKKNLRGRTNFKCEVKQFLYKPKYWHRRKCCLLYKGILSY